MFKMRDKEKKRKEIGFDSNKDSTFCSNNRGNISGRIGVVV